MENHPEQCSMHYVSVLINTKCVSSDAPGGDRGQKASESPMFPLNESEHQGFKKLDLISSVKPVHAFFSTTQGPSLRGFDLAVSECLSSTASADRSRKSSNPRHGVSLAPQSWEEQLRGCEMPLQEKG